VVVDSLPAAAPGTGTLDESLALTARELKALARERDAALLLVTPLPRLDPARANPRPRLGDLGALGAPAQHADVVLALFREEMYGAAPGTEGATELLVLKNRNGPTGYVDLYFDAPHLRFEDMLDPEG
jgi:replicative DNA helicase